MSDLSFTLVIKDDGTAVIKRVETAIKEMGIAGGVTAGALSGDMNKVIVAIDSLIGALTSLKGSFTTLGSSVATGVSVANAQLSSLKGNIIAVQAEAAKGIKIVAPSAPGGISIAQQETLGVSAMQRALGAEAARSKSTIDMEAKRSAEATKVAMNASISAAKQEALGVSAMQRILGAEAARSREEIAKSAGATEEAMNKAGRGVKAVVTESDKFHRTLERIERTAKAFIAMWMLTKIVSVFSDIVKTGIQFNALIEQSRLGIASIIVSQGTFTDSVGQTLSGYDALISAQRMSDNIIKQLQVDNLSTIATFDQLVRAFQQTLAPGLEKGFNVDQVRQFTIAMVQAAGAMGLNLDMLAEETRSLLRGTISPRQTLIASALGLRNEDIAKYKGDSKGLFDFLMGKLEAFRFAGIESQKTWMGLASNVKDAFKVSLGAGFEDLFKFAKQEASDLLKYLIIIDGTTGKMKVNPEVVESFRRIGEFTQALYSTLKDVAGVIVNTLGPALSGMLELWRSISISAEAWRRAVSGGAGGTKEEGWAPGIPGVVPSIKEPEWFGKYRGKGLYEKAVMGLKEYNDWISGETRRKEIEKYYTGLSALYGPTEAYAPNIPIPGGEEEGEKALFDIQMKIAEINKDYAMQKTLIGLIVDLKEEELKKENKLTENMKDAIDLEKGHNITLIDRKKLLDENARAQDLSGYRSQIAGLKEDYAAEASEIKRQSELLIANKLVSQEWNAETDKGLITIVRQTAARKADQVIIDGIYKDTKRMAEAQAQYGNLVGSLAPQFALERLELEKELKDLKDKNKLTDDYRKLKERIQGIKEEKATWEDYSKSVIALTQMGAKYSEMFGDAETYRAYAERQMTVELRGMNLEIKLLTEGGNIGKANLLTRQKDMKIAMDTYDIEMKAFEIENKIPNMLDQQLSKQADLLSDYELQKTLIDNQLLRERDRINIMKETGILTDKVAKTYLDSLDMIANKYKELIELEKKTYGPDMLNQARASYAEATGQIGMQNEAMQGLLESNIARMRADEKIKGLTEEETILIKNLLEIYMRLDAVLQGQLRLLEKRNQLEQFKGDLATLQGSWLGMKNAEIAQLEIERQKLVAINKEYADIINKIYDIKRAKTVAERDLNVPALMGFGLEEYSLKTTQNLVDAYKNLIPNAIDSTTNAFLNLFDNLKSGTMSTSDAIQQFFSNIGESVVKLMLDIAMLIVKMEILKAMGYGQSTGVSGGAGIGSILSIFSGIYGALFPSPGAPALSWTTAAGGGITPGLLAHYPLHSYQGGGIARTPQIGIFGEAGEEAFVPLKGGKIPVEGGKGNTYITYIEATDVDSFRRRYGNTIEGIYRGGKRFSKVAMR